MKILLLKKGALGDVLLTTPLVRQLRKNFPDSQIDYWVGDISQTALQKNQHLDRSVGFDEKIFTQKNVFKFLRLVNRIKTQHYDVAFVLDKHWVYALAVFLARVPRRLGFLRDWLSCIFLTHQIDRRPIRHEILYYLDLLHLIGNVDYKDTKIDFSISTNAKSRTNSLIKNFVVVVNSGGDNLSEQSQVRKLPDEKFRELLSKLSAVYKVALIGGENDTKYYQQFTNSQIINFAGQLSLEESAALMQRATHIYTTDSGPMHLAASVNENITAFFGPTNPARKAPLVSNIKTVWDDQDIYEEAYELCGRVPKSIFFTRLDFEEVEL